MCEILNNVMSHRFHIRDFNNLLHDGINYELPMEIIALLTRLDETIEVIEFPNHSSHNHSNTGKPHSRVNSDGFTSVNTGSRPHRNNKPTTGHSNNLHLNLGDKHKSPNNANKKSPPSLEDWSTARQFKTTKFEVKVGVDKLINDIRISLNKISNTTYDKHRDIILKLVHDIYQNDMEESSSSDEDEASPTTSEEKKKQTGIQRVCTVISDIAAGNKFYSEMYAKLYLEIIQTEQFSDTFRASMNEIISLFPLSFDSYKYIDESVDMDGFCAMNKANDRRKATAMFIVNLMKLNAIEKTDIMNIIVSLLNRILSSMQFAEKSKEIEEITENVFILVSNSKSLLNENELWKNEINPHIEKLSSSSIKQANPGMTSRAVFKFMDM